MARVALFRLVEHADRRAQLAGGAVAALEGVLVDERLLHLVQVVAVTEPLGGHDLGALIGHRERQAADDPATVDQHSARAALPVVASLLGGEDAQAVAEAVEQGRARVHDDVAEGTVHGQRDSGFHIAGRTRRPGR
ncbi:Uncharacterised protein [Clostridioides difficile]|nr:Uncharacterised protein [Clostridioides difficile]